jgi:hypothetical protein
MERKLLQLRLVNRPWLIIGPLAKTKQRTLFAKAEELQSQRSQFNLTTIRCWFEVEAAAFSRVQKRAQHIAHSVPMQRIRNVAPVAPRRNETYLYCGGFMPGGRTYRSSTENFSIPNARKPILPVGKLFSASVSSPRLIKTPVSAGVIV